VGRDVGRSRRVAVLEVRRRRKLVGGVVVVALLVVGDHLQRDEV